MSVPDLPGFPSVQVDGGNARLYRVHGPTCLLALAIGVRGIDARWVFCFSEHGRLGNTAWLAREPGEMLAAMQLYRAAADPHGRERHEAPRADEIPNVRELRDRPMLQVGEKTFAAHEA